MKRRYSQEQPERLEWRPMLLQQQQTFAAVAAVGTVAAAGVSAYSAYSSSQAKSDAAGAYGTKVTPVPYNDRIGTEDSYAAQIGPETTKSLEGSLPEIFSIARRVDNYDRRKRERDSGGTFAATQQQEGANILAMEKGQIPADVEAQIQRMVAEHLGGAFDPSFKSGGFSFSSTAADSARRLGLTSLDIMSKGMSFAPQWRNSVDSFIYKPQDAMKDFYLPQEQVGLAASQIQLQRDQNQYVSDNNIARAAAMPNPQVVGAANDALTSGAAESQAIGNFSKALPALYSAFKPTSTPAATPAAATPTVKVNPAYLGGTPYG